MTPPKRAAGQGRAPAGPGCARRSAAPVADAAPPDPPSGLVPTDGGSGTPSSLLPSEAATGKPGPATGAAESCPVPAAPDRVRAGTPAGGALDADGASPDRSQALSGEAFRREYAKRLAQRGASSRGNRARKTARPAAASRQAVVPPVLPAAGPVAGLTASAHCGSCEWTAGPGGAGDVDDAAAKHVRPGHATATVAEPVAGAA